MSAVRAWVLAALASVGLAAGARAAVTAEQAGASASAWCGRVLAAGWARPDTDVFVAQRVDSARGFWFVHVGQRWRELAVLPVDVCVVLDREGQVAHWSGELARVPAPSGPRTLAAAGAVFRSRAVARAALADPGQCEPVVWVGGGPARHAWRVRFEQAVPPAPGEVIVDGERGEVLASAGGALHAQGYVYPNDGRDALSEVSLSGLDGDGTVLRGGKVRVLDGSWPDLAAPLGDYRIVPSEPDTTRFDDVNVWWRVQGYLGWLHSLGYTGPRDTLHVRVHAPIAPEVAYTYRDYVYLGEAMAGFSHDAAKAADVTVHELQHFVATDYGLVHGTSETDALQEGLSDYMAAAYTGDARIGEWVYIPFPNGVTTVASSPAVFRYDNYGYVSWGGVDVGSTWANGMIFSGALWDLRGAIGATADSLVLEAMPRVTAAPDFQAFATGLASADLDLHAGLHRDAIRQAMTGRGIGALTHMVIQGPDSLYSKETGTFQLVATPFVLGEDATWTVNRLRGGVVSQPGAFVGTGTSVTYADTGDFVLTASAPTSYGATITAQWQVGIRAPGLPWRGPWQLAPGVPGTFTILAGTPMATTTPAWYVRRWCGTAPCGPPFAVGSGWSVTYADSLDFEMIATTTDAWANPVRDSVFVSVDQPRVTVVGPRYFDNGTYMYYVAQASGGGLWKYSWTRYSVPRGPVTWDLGTSQSTSAYSSVTFDLGVKVTDWRGRSTTAEARIFALTLGLAGPARAEAGVSVRFSAVVDTLFGDMVATWETRRSCNGVPCGDGWRTVGTGPTLDYASDTDYELRLTLTGAYHFALTRSTVVHIAPPTVRIGALGPMSFEGLGYRARATGGAPLAFAWSVTAAGTVAPVAAPGLGDSVVVAQAPPYRITVMVTDVNGRYARDSLVVMPDTSWAPAPTARAGMSAAAVAGSEASMLVWAPAGVRAELLVYDLGGREVARWYDGVFPGGARLLMRHTHELGQGMYFVRWRAGGSGVVRRLAVVR